MNEITLLIEPCAETGGFVARWDAPGGGDIATQGDSFAELDATIVDAVIAYFEPEDRAQTGRLYFTEDPIVAVV